MDKVTAFYEKNKTGSENDNYPYLFHVSGKLYLLNLAPNSNVFRLDEKVSTKVLIVACWSAGNSVLLKISGTAAREFSRKMYLNIPSIHYLQFCNSNQ